MISIKGLRQGLLIIFSDEHVPWLTKLRELEEKLVAGGSFFLGAQAAFDVRGLDLGGDDLKRLLDLSAAYTIAPFAIISSNDNTRRQVEALGLATRLPSPQPVRKASAPAPPPMINDLVALAVGVAESPVATQSGAEALSAPPATPMPAEDSDESPAEAQPAALQTADAETAQALGNPAVEAPSPAPIVTTATIAAAITAAEENQERGTDGALIKRRVRSGQIIRHPGHIVVVGDVNPGARIEAGGDIIVWGKLQGTAHAGAFGNTKSVICALEMTPNLVKIADLIIRNHRGKAEMAAIKEQEIVFTRWESKG
jgi:septum site-determining protein MinC